MVATLLPQPWTFFKKGKQNGCHPTATALALFRKIKKMVANPPLSYHCLGFFRVVKKSLKPHPHHSLGLLRRVKNGRHHSLPQPWIFFTRVHKMVASTLPQPWTFLEG